MRLYFVLLYLYPASFRAEYGDELYRIFERRRQQAGSPFSLIGLWLGEFIDILVDATCVHWDILRQDLRYTARTLSRARGFALTAIVVTALGIGATTAVFSVADHVMLRPLPFPASERLVQLWHRTLAYSSFEVSPPNFYDWRRLSSSFDSMAAYDSLALNVVGEGEPRRVEATGVTPEFFGILGVQPLIGRGFSKEDAKVGAPRTVILSYRFWQDVFAGRPNILDTTVHLNDDSYSVVGVMPQDFIFPNRNGQLWIPLALADPPTEGRDNYYLSIIGRLKSGIALDKVRAEMSVIGDQLARAYPNENAGVGVRIDPLADQVPNQTRLLLWTLFGASLCVLLIACTNLGNLLLAKAIGRRKELALRAAIGAGRDRLVRQLLTESILLATAGGTLGIAVAVVALPLLSTIIPAGLPLSVPTVLDRRVLFFTALVTLGTGLIFGVWPAWRVSRGVDQDGLREGSRSGVGGRRDRLRSFLVSAEITLSLVLLVSSGLLMRALWRIQSTYPGFHADAVLTIQTALPMPRYAQASKREAFYNEVLSEVRSLRGVSNAAYISSLPMTPGGGIWPVAVTGSNTTDADTHGANSVGMRLVTPGYFDTMGIPIRAGRDMRESDSLDAAPVAIVSESFAKLYWPNQNPLGRQFHFAMNDFSFAQEERVIVGVVGDVRFRGLERPSEPQVYLSSRQLPDNTSIFYAPKELVVRSSTDTAALIPLIRPIIHRADPELPISALRPLSEVVDLQTAPRVTQLRLVAVFTIISLILACTGIYGLLSFTVGQRLPEFGVRMALGAQSSDIMSIVLREAMILAGVAALCGLFLSYAAARAIQTLLAGVAPFDPATLAFAAVVAFAMTISGCILPAFRAMRIDPAMVVRME